MTGTTPGEVIADPGSPWGYRRSPDVEARFRDAAARLTEADGWPDAAGRRRLRADLVLEGGGVKGIGLVGAILALADAGYSFPRVAGTSAGAIVGALVAAIDLTGRPMTALRGYLDDLHLTQFAPMGPLRQWLDDAGRLTRAVTDVGLLTRRSGLHPGDRVERWLRPILHDDFGVRTFADLRIPEGTDPGTGLAETQRYRLVVHVSDITRGQLVRLPWDYEYYGLDPDVEDVVTAVRASMSIPFYFDPMVVQARPAEVTVPTADGALLSQRYEGGTVTWVDGGLLQNFPVHAFDRTDGVSSRWPTIGIRLSRPQRDFPTTSACQSALEIALRCLHTAINEWDRYHVDQSTAARTVFVDNAGLTATQFDLSDAQRQTLFLNGVRAATDFVVAAAAAGSVLRRRRPAAPPVATPRAVAAPA